MTATGGVGGRNLPKPQMNSFAPKARQSDKNFVRRGIARNKI